MPIFNDTTRISFGTWIDDLLIECQFNMKRCSKNDFEWFYDGYYGLCFKFNANKTKISARKGKLSGLALKLYIPEPYGVNNFISISKGVKYFITYI